MTGGMPKQRQARRRRRHRPADLPPGAAPVPPPAEARRPRDISWTGLAGGALGVLLLGQAAVYVLVSPGDSSRWAALPLFLAAALYLPAIWASVAQTAGRQRVQRGVLAVTLVVVVIGLLFTGPGFAALLLVPSTLLAIASGLIFQGGRPAK